ncbi:putative TPR repeat protein oca3 [Halenospora varia]|nr:putative TPR repeat protein oca3 [Halenospora varia]
MLSCLRTGDEQSAHLCLQRLTARFGSDNERLMAFRGLFQEATAKDDSELKNVLEEYDVILAKDPSNMPVTKRRIALLKALRKIPEAITSLNALLDASPTDAEAWAELSELYLSQGMYPQAIFALEEVLLVTPNAWNIHARLGEVLYVAASASEGGAERHLSESMRRFCRSIELCDDYLRGYYGLKITTTRLLTTLSPNSRQSKADTGLPSPDIKNVERLNELATAKLSEIVRRNGSRTCSKADLRRETENFAKYVPFSDGHLDADLPPLSSWPGSGPQLDRGPNRGTAFAKVGTNQIISGISFGVVPRAAYDDDSDSWEQLYDNDEVISPSESASRPTSRPRNGPRYRQSESRPPPATRGPTRRHTTTERPPRRPPVSRVHRHPAPIAPSTVDPLEDYPGYGRGFPAQPTAPFGGRAPGPSYAQSSFSGAPPGFAPPPFGPAPGALTHYAQPGQYQYAPPPGNPFSPQGNGGPPGGGAGYFGNHSGHNTPGPYGGHDVMPYGHPGYGGYPGYQMPPGMPPQFAQYPQWPPSDHSVAPDPETEKKLAAVEELMKSQKIDFDKARAEIAAQEAQKLKEMAEREAKALKELADRDAKEAAAKAAAAAAKKAADEKAEWERKIKEEKDWLEKKNSDERAAIEKRAADEKAALEKKIADEKAAYEKQLADDKARWEKTVEEEKKAAQAKGAETVRKQVEAERKKAEAEAAEAARQAAIEAKIKKLEDDLASGTKKLRDEAAAEQKKLKEDAAAEAAKLKKEADEEAEKLKKEAAEALKKAMAKPADEPKKPIKFKDAVGRKFSFPFHLCATWQGMEDLIKQAFLHVEVIGPHVQDGHYDLIGPNGEIILPQVWETMIEPDWAVTMHMWPMPEPKQPEPGPPPGHHFMGERPRSRHEGRHGDPRQRGPPPGPPPQGQRGPPPPPPPGNWPGPGGRGPPPGHERMVGGDPVIVVHPRRSPPPSKPARRKTEPSKGVLNFFAGGKAAKSSGKGKSVYTSPIQRHKQIPNLSRSKKS